MTNQETITFKDDRGWKKAISVQEILEFIRKNKPGKFEPGKKIRKTDLIEAASKLSPRDYRQLISDKPDGIYEDIKIEDTRVHPQELIEPTKIELYPDGRIKNIKQLNKAALTIICKDKGFDYNFPTVEEAREYIAGLDNNSKNRNREIFTIEESPEEKGEKGAREDELYEHTYVNTPNFRETLTDQSTSQINNTLGESWQNITNDEQFTENLQGIEEEDLVIDQPANTPGYVAKQTLAINPTVDMAIVNPEPFRNYKPIKPPKPIFGTNDKDDIEQFFKNYESLVRGMVNEEQERIENLEYCLEGRAKKYFQNNRNELADKDWEEIKAKFVKHFKRG